MRMPTNDTDRLTLAQDLKVEDEKKRVWDEEYEKEGKGVKESSSDSNVAVSANAQEAKLSTRISPRSETESKIKKDVGGRRLAGNFRMLRFGRTKVEAVDSGLFACTLNTFLVEHRDTTILFLHVLVMKLKLGYLSRTIPTFHDYHLTNSTTRSKPTRPWFTKIYFIGEAVRRTQ